MAGSPARRRAAAGWRWLVLALLLSALGSLWAVASPPFSVPDEPAHTVKAAAVARLQLWGTEVPAEDGATAVKVEVPDGIAFVYQVPACFAFNAEATADCAPVSLQSEGRDRWIGTPAVSYPPLYYAAVGWPTVVSQRLEVLYASRVVSAAAAGALIAAGLWALAGIADRRWVVAGGLVVVTPMVAFLAGSVNPNGLENAAAVALWGFALAAVRHAEARGVVPRAVAVGVVVAGAVLAGTRWLSPGFVLVILGLSALTVPVRRWGAVLRAERMRPTLAGVGGAVALSLALVALAPDEGLTPAAPVPEGTSAVEAILAQYDQYAYGLVGYFGWLDTPPPRLLVAAWSVLALTVVGVGLRRGRRPLGLALAGCAGVSLVLPVAAQVPTAEDWGLVWQGRYSLPLALGIPLLALAAVPPGRVGRPLAAAVATVAAAGHLLALAWAVRRYATGLTGSWDLLGDAAWEPWPGMAPTAVLALAVLGALVALVVTWPGGDPVPAPVQVQVPVQGSAPTDGVSGPGEGPGPAGPAPGPG